MCHTQQIAAVIGLMLIAGVTEAANDGWYVGAGIGAVSSNYNVANFDDGSIGSSSIDNSDSAWKLFTGYALNPQFAIEASYADLHNDTDRTTTFSGTSDGTGGRYESLPGGRVSVDIDDVTALVLEVIGSLPLTSRLSVHAYAGIVRWTAQQTTIDLRRRNVDLDGTGTIFGAGLEYRFVSRIAIRNDIGRYSDVGFTDDNVITTSVLLRF